MQKERTLIDVYFPIKKFIFWLLSEFIDANVLLPTSYVLCTMPVGSYKTVNIQFLGKDNI